MLARGEKFFSKNRGTLILKAYLGVRNRLLSGHTNGGKEVYKTITAEKQNGEILCHYEDFVK